MFIPFDAPAPAILDDFLSQRQAMLIGGSWCEARSGNRLDVVDPSSGRRIADVPAADGDDVDLAVIAAREALAGPWHKVPPHERAGMMHTLADLIEARGEEIAALEALEQGKLLSIAQLVEVEAAADYLRYMAGWATKVEGSTFELSPRGHQSTQYNASTRREPVGVVAAIVPWNFPHLMAVYKIAPVLATGCTTVLKPAEQTPLTALLLAELVTATGIPPGVVNVVTGFGDPAGSALSRHRGIDKVAFTGSTSVGKKIGVDAMNHMTRVSLELGGKSPVLVLEDADAELVAEGMLSALFFNSGQHCSAGSRLYLPASRFDEMLDRVACLAGELRIGSPFDPTVQLGPLVSAAQRDKVVAYVESGRADGAEVVLGGNRLESDGYFVEPTILSKTDHSMRVVREEIFGPVLVAMPYRDTDHLLKMANDTEFGLAASVWSQDVSRIHDLVSKLRAGTVWVNTHGVFDPNLPFGGFKQSGLGREHGRAGIDAYTELKSVCIAYRECS